jgi:deazaflavin-dependent oxidoreductase (nitroreductase family)
MARALKHVDPHRRRGRFTRAIASFSASKVGRFVSAHVAWKLDPLLLRATGGRLSMSMGIPTALLETRGAKTGELRRHAVIYFHDGDRVTIVASLAGAVKHPAWYHNLLADPDVVLGGHPMRATVVRDEAERTRLWALADNVFAPFARYRQDAAAGDRTIPIIQLTPAAPLS